MTFLNEKSFECNQSVTKNDEIGGNERFSRNLLPTKFLLPSRIKGFS